MKQPHALTLALFILLAGAPGLAADKILIGNTGSAASLQWPSHVAIAKGFYKEAGLDVELVPMPSSAAGLQQLTAGATNINSSGVVDAARAIDKGAPISLLRMEGQTSPYEIYAQPGIKAFADLRNKTVMIGGIKDITRIYFEEVANANGLKAGEFDYVFAGTTSSRYAALASGVIAATIITPPFNFQAAKAGYTRLGGSSEVTSRYPFSAYSANVRWAKANPRVVKAFLAAYARGVEFMYDPANAAEAQAIFVKLSNANPEDVRLTYDFYQKIRLWDVEGSVTAMGGMQGVIELMKTDGELDGPADMKRFYDPSLSQ
jgi:ABC-type nitrate/sulfonate/bicarbonate transport system substrate-binding protein